MKLRLSVGIPAYNCEAHIAELLGAILKQEDSNFELTEIFVYCDACQDHTVQVARSFKNQLIKVTDDRTRGGMARGLLNMFEQFQGDVFILLNDDVQIKSRYTFSRVLAPFMSGNSQLGIVSGNPQPLAPRTFIEAAGISTFRVYEQVRNQINHGNNKFSCDGKFLALSRPFIKKMTFPKDFRDMANVDAFLYFSCLKFGFRYHHVPAAKVFFTFPSTMTDYVNWNSRNNADPYILAKSFDDKLIRAAYAKPFVLYLKALIQEGFRNPVGCITAGLLGIYCHYRAKKIAPTLAPTWQTIRSTKFAHTS